MHVHIVSISLWIMDNNNYYHFLRKKRKMKNKNPSAPSILLWLSSCPGKLWKKSEKNVHRRRKWETLCGGSLFVTCIENGLSATVPFFIHPSIHSSRNSEWNQVAEISFNECTAYMIHIYCIHIYVYIYACKVFTKSILYCILHDCAFGSVITCI